MPTPDPSTGTLSLNLDDADYRALGGELSDLLTDYEREHSQRIADVEVSWKLYDAEPRQKTRTFPWRGAPLARDTEVLTREGWQRVDELHLGDIVLTRRDEDGKLEWQPILATPSVHAADLLHFKSKSIDQLVTREHQMVGIPEHEKAKGTYRPRRVTAQHLWDHTGYRVPLTGYWEGQHPDKLFDLQAGDVMEFIGWYLSEGWYNIGRYPNGTVSKGTIFIGQSRTSNPEKCRRLEDLFERLCFSWRHAGSNESYYIHVRSMPRELAKLLRGEVNPNNSCEGKRLPRFVFDLSPDLLWRLLDGLMLGDGCHHVRENRNHDAFTYYTTAKRLADDIQILAALIGMRATIREHTPAPGGSIIGRRIVGVKTGYVVTICHKRYAKIDAAKRSVVRYDDEAFCVTVRNHAICVRRDGIPSWTGNSNIVVPYIRTAADAIIAQHISLVFDNPTRVWVSRSENESFADKYEPDVLRFINWAARNEIDGFFAVLDWINENVVLGQSYLMASWREVSRYVLLPRRKGTVGRPPGPQKVTLRRSVVWEHIPQEAILYESGVPIQESQLVSTQAFLTWGDLVRNVEAMGWREDAVRRTRDHPAQGTPGAEVRDWKEQREGLTRDRLVSNRGDYDIRTVFVDWPVLESMGIDRERVVAQGDESVGRVSVPLVVELCPQSREVLRVYPYPYLAFPGWTIFDLYFRKRSGRPSSPGVARILDHIQRGMTTMVNQAIDAVTLANAMPFGTTDPKWKDKRLQPGQGVYTDRTEAIYPLNITKNILPDIAIVNLLQVMGERVSGVNDPLLGRETRMGGHPSPATNVLTQLQQTRELGAPAAKMLRRAMGKLGEATATLYQMFDTDPEGRITRVFGEQDGARITEWLFPTDESIVGNLHMDLFTLSETQNPQQQAQQALLRAQVTQNYYAAILPLIQQLGDPALMRQAVTQFIQGFTKSHRYFLEATDTDDIDTFLFEMNRSNQTNQLAMQEFANAIQGRLAEGTSPAQDAGPAAGPLAGPFTRAARGSPLAGLQGGANGARPNGGTLPPGLG